MISDLTFGSVLVYSPRGQSDISKKSRDVCYAVKNGHPALLAGIAQHLRQLITNGNDLGRLFPQGVTLVPMPRSAPLVQGALWPAERIALAIIASGIIGTVEPILTRTIAVPKSSRAARGERPGVSTHYDSLSAAHRIGITDRILIVDDVVTKGTTALAAASRLAETYPNAEIGLFTFLRTKGLVPDIDKMDDPTMGQVHLYGDEGDRQP